MSVSSDEREQILRIARESIQTAFANTDITELRPTSPDGALSEPRGAFVTLKRAGRLRGCIGRVESSDPLWETVATMARSAAFEDPRFEPLGQRELADTHIEVSVLSMVEPIRPEDVVVGTHGLIAERGFNRGLLLPQVPGEWGWDRETFLAETCHKAGLPRDAWRDGQTRFLAFTAEVFGER